MTPDEARAVLGLGAGAGIDEAVARHRQLQLRHHPDVVGGSDPAATIVSARLNQALAVLRETSDVPPPPPTTAAGTSVRPDRRIPGFPGPVEVRTDGDSILVGAPPDETWIRLHEAGSTLGGVGHIDPRLGLLELIVRFEGGPSCSVLLTLQGRSHGTEVFCEMESIEAAPTPPIAPVVEALASALVTAHPRPGPPD